MRNIIIKYWVKLKETAGATAIEYALIAALVGVALVAALNTLSGDIQATFTDVGDQLNP